MVASVLGGAFASSLIREFTGAIIKELIKSPGVPVTPDNASSVAPGVENAVEKAVEKEIGPRINHLTNNEPWYRSNVTWGAIGAILGGTATLITHLSLGTPLSWEAYGPPILAIFGGVQALYGRWIARKPIGR